LAVLLCDGMRAGIRRSGAFLFAKITGHWRLSDGVEGVQSRLSWATRDGADDSADWSQYCECFDTVGWTTEKTSAL